MTQPTILLIEDDENISDPLIFGLESERMRARKQSGAGLGLALVRAMIEANNGTIAVDSRVNQGSQFTVHLPIPNHSSFSPLKHTTSALAQPLITQS